VSVTAPRPGTQVRTRTAPPSRTAPTDTGVWFVAGLTDRGPLRPVTIGSLQDFINTFGSRQTYSNLYDALELFFRDGGAQAVVSRVVGPGAVIASVTLNEAGGSPIGSLVVKAKGPGAYANTLRVTVAAVTGGYTLTVSDTTLGTLEVSPTLADQQSAVAWSKTSLWVDITLGGASAIPAAVSNAALTGGTDDRNSVTDTHWVTALNRFTKDLGPGQVTQVGRTTSQAHSDTLAHAAAFNRVAILDLPDSPSAATVEAAAAAQRNGVNDAYGGAFGPWVVIPGLTPGTTRIVPPSALVCAKIAENDVLHSANSPAAGDPEGISGYAIGLSQPAYDDGTGIDVTRDTMYSAGVNQIVYMGSVYMVYGWRSLVDPLGAEQSWTNLGNVRFRMQLTALGNAILSKFVLKEIDGAGHVFSKVAGQLIGMLSGFWPDSLYGATPEEAFVVDVGSSVNTPTTIANREIHAAMAVRMSEDGELVVLEITKVPVNQSL